MKTKEQIAYDHYVAWCERMGYHIASEEVYFQTTHGIYINDLSRVSAGSSLPPDERGVK